MEDVELARMTWKEVEAVQNRRPVVLIPMGTQEQNGLVCPEGTDCIITYEVSKRVARETEAVVAPIISYGNSSRHNGFPGTISLRPETLRMLLVDVCSELIRSGFDHLLIVNSHMNNEPIMEHAAREIRQQHGIMVGHFNPIELGVDAGRDLFPALGNLHGHGDERMASLLLAIDPGVVRMDAAQPGRFGEFDGIPVVGSSKLKLGDAVFGLFHEYRDTSKTGINGNPGAADASLGAELMRRVVRLASNYVTAFRKLRVAGRG
jgi:creatinine amidohydrolase